MNFPSATWRELTRNDEDPLDFIKRHPITPSAAANAHAAPSAACTDEHEFHVWRGCDEGPKKTRGLDQTLRDNNLKIKSGNYSPTVLPSKKI